MKLADLILRAFLEEHEERVGRAPMELVKELEEVKEAHRKAHEEIERQIKEFAQRLNEKHAPICAMYAKREAEIWEKIYDAVGVPENEREHEYNIDRLTGVVSRVVKKLPEQLEQKLEQMVNNAQQTPNKNGGGVH